MATTSGKGSTFSVRIPRNGPAAAESASPTAEEIRPRMPERGIAGFVQEVDSWTLAPPEPSGSEAANGRSGKVLVVDDNADLRGYLRTILESHFEVFVAADGMDALQQLRAREVDVVVSDVMMPRLGGFGLLRELRADPRLQAVPFILLSARAGEEAAVEGLEAGADDYLIKPFSARELLARVQTQRTMSQLRAEAATLLAREAALKQALQERDDFLSVASHELKTPLAGMQLQLGASNPISPAMKGRSWTNGWPGSGVRSTALESWWTGFWMSPRWPRSASFFDARKSTWRRWCGTASRSAEKSSVIQTARWT